MRMPIQKPRALLNLSRRGHGSVPRLAVLRAGKDGSNVEKRSTSIDQLYRDQLILPVDQPVRIVQSRNDSARATTRE